MRARDTDKERLVKQKAIECIVKDGFEGFSMNKLAKACGISVATLYIYYKDRDDLIIKVATEEGNRMGESMIKGVDPEASFEEGLRIQWKNRYQYLMENPFLGPFFDQLHSSSYQEYFADSLTADFKVIMGKFIKNAIARGEINEMPFEVYWAIAFSPLYALIRYHHRRQSIGGRPFKMTDEILWKTFDLVVKALKN